MISEKDQEKYLIFFKNNLIKFPNPDKYYLLHFYGRIPDYRLVGKHDPDKTFPTSD